VTTISSGNAPPLDFHLEQNYPNPFNPTTAITYHVGGAGDSRPPGSPAGERITTHVRIVVYDLLGREVALLVNEQKPPGSCTVRFDADGLATGAYLYRMTAGDIVQTRRMMLMR